MRHHHVDGQHRSVEGPGATRRAPARGRSRAPSPAPPARWAAATLGALIASLVPGLLAAQEADAHSHRQATDHHAGLHFTHPMIAESVSPDTKIRIDHRYFEFPEGDLEHSGLLEVEYAFHRGFSIEAGIPYSYSATEFGNAEVLFKFANYAFEEAGLLLGYGLEIGFPTNGTPEEEEPPIPDAEPAAARGGSDRSIASSRGRAAPAPRLNGGGAGVEGTLGTDEWELAPFLNVGYERGPFELVAWGIFGIPFNQEDHEEVATELSYNLSALFRMSSRVQVLLELDGAGGISGHAVGEDVANLSPGLRVRLLPDRPLVLGTSVGFPLTNEEGFDVRWASSLFWHF